MAQILCAILCNTICFLKHCKFQSMFAVPSLGKLEGYQVVSASHLLKSKGIYFVLCCLLNWPIAQQLFYINTLYLQDWTSVSSRHPQIKSE